MSQAAVDPVEPGRRASLDLTRFAPEAELLQGESSAFLKRFRRYHRLGQPCLLFAGPYTRRGGLDVAVEATYLLRGRFEDVRLAAIPTGPVDRTFLDECEMRALGLGHRGIVEWTLNDDELPFWFATATVVYGPEHGALDTPRLAAAAGRPFVGGEVDAEALADACSRLFAAS